MKATILTLTIAALTLAQLPCAFADRLTSDDPNFRDLFSLSESIGWYQNRGFGSWSLDQSHDHIGTAACTELLDRVRAVGVPDTRTLEIGWDGPEFRHGIHTLAEIHTSCEHADRVSKVQSFERWAIPSMQDASSGTRYEFNYRNCIKVYREIVKNGISPSELVAERKVGDVPWSGTIKELRQKWCDTGMQASREATEQTEAPFRKELEGDRLEIALRYRGVGLPGGANKVNPHKMAAAFVWFVDFSPPRHCTDGRQIHLLRRYQFGPAEELVKKTEQEFCGPAPISAYQ